MLNFFLVFLGGGFGSCLRYSFSIFIPNKAGVFPYATFCANLISCLLIGLLIGAFSKSLISEQQRLLLVTGFCGGFSTFSAFGVEIYDLYRLGNYGIVVTYILLSILLGVLLVGLGLAISNVAMK